MNDIPDGEMERPEREEEVRQPDRQVPPVGKVFAAPERGPGGRFERNFFEAQIARMFRRRLPPFLMREHIRRARAGGPARGSDERRVRKDLHQNLEQFVFLLRPAPIDQNLVDDGLQKADEQPPGRRAAGDFVVSARKDLLERLGGEIFKLDPLVILCRIFPHDQSANALLDDFPETPFFFRGCFSLETALKEGVQRSGLHASTVTGGTRLSQSQVISAAWRNSTAGGLQNAANPAFKLGEGAVVRPKFFGNGIKGGRGGENTRVERMPGAGNGGVSAGSRGSDRNHRRSHER